MDKPNINLQFDPMKNTVFVGNDAEMKLDTHVVQPSILYNLDMTHNDFIEYHNCIIDNKESISNIQNSNDANNKIKNEFEYFDNIFKKEKDTFNIYLFNVWKNDDQFSEIRFLIEDFNTNLHKIFINMYHKLHPHYLNMKDQHIFDINDLAISSICLKTSIVYYIDPNNLKKNDDDLIQTILKDDVFFTKVFCLYYFIQAKHQLKNITNDYNKSLYIKNVINTIVYNHQQYYNDLDNKIKNKDTSVNLYRKLIVDKIEHYTKESKSNENNNVIHVTKDEQKEIESLAKQEVKNIDGVDTKKGFIKKRVEKISVVWKSKLSKTINYIERIEQLKLENDENKIKNSINNVIFKNTSWGKITGFLHHFVTQFINNFFYYFFQNDEKECDFNILHNFMDLYLLKGNSVLFITAGILLNDICKDINKKDELKIIYTINDNGYYSQDNKNNDNVIDKYIEHIKNNNIKFNILYNKVKSSVQYMEETYSDINYLANDTKLFWKKYKKTYNIEFKKLKYSKFIEKYNVDLLATSEVKKKALDNIKGEESQEDIESKLKFIYVDFFLIKSIDLSLIDNDIIDKKDLQKDFCLEFAQKAKLDNYDIKNIKNTPNQCFYNNVTKKQAQRLEYEKAKKEIEEDEKANAASKENTASKENNISNTPNENKTKDIKWEINEELTKKDRLIEEKENEIEKLKVTAAKKEIEDEKANAENQTNNAPLGYLTNDQLVKYRDSINKFNIQYKKWNDIQEELKNYNNNNDNNDKKKNLTNLINVIKKQNLNTNGPIIKDDILIHPTHKYINKLSTNWKNELIRDILMEYIKNQKLAKQQNKKGGGKIGGNKNDELNAIIDKYMKNDNGDINRLIKRARQITEKNLKNCDDNDGISSNSKSKTVNEAITNQTHLNYTYDIIQHLFFYLYKNDKVDNMEDASKKKFDLDWWGEKISNEDIKKSVDNYRNAINGKDKTSKPQDNDEVDLTSDDDSEDVEEEDSTKDIKTLYENVIKAIKDKTNDNNFFFSTFKNLVKTKDKLDYEDELGYKKYELLKTKDPINIIEKNNIIEFELSYIINQNLKKDKLKNSNSILEHIHVYLENEKEDYLSPFLINELKDKTIYLQYEKTSNKKTFKNYWKQNNLNNKSYYHFIFSNILNIERDDEESYNKEWNKWQKKKNR